MALYQVYFDITEKAQRVYGAKTVVFMQVGSFFEIYAGYDRQTHTYHGSCLEDIAKLCDLAMPKKNHDISLSRFGIPRKGPIHMAGFQPMLYEREVGKLEDAGYTILIYLQVNSTTDSFMQICPEWFLNLEEKLKEHKQTDTLATTQIPHVITLEKGTQRFLAETLSPGSMIQSNTTRTSNYIASLWITKTRRRKTGIEYAHIGVSFFDTFSGEPKVYEFEMEYHITPATLEKITKLVSSYQPREYLIVYDMEELAKGQGQLSASATSSTQTTQTTQQNLSSLFENYMGIHGLVHRFFLTKDDPIARFEKQIVQQQLLEQWYAVGEYHSFEASTMLMNYPFGTTSFVHLLSFLQEHNARIVHHLELPRINTPEDTMMLANHSLEQLNILTSTHTTSGSARTSSVEAWVNRCKTPMGKRRLHHMLTHPTVNTTRLTSWYNAVEFASASTQEIHDMRKCLEQCHDIERDYRRAVLNTLTPRHLANMIHTFDHMKTLLAKEAYAHPCWNKLMTQEGIGLTIQDAQQHIDTLTHLFQTYIRADMCEATVGYQFEKNLFHRVEDEPSLCELDDMDKQYSEILWVVHHLQAYIHEVMSAKDKSSRSQRTVEYTKLYETDGMMYLVMTKKRASTLKTLLKQPKMKKAPTRDQQAFLTTLEYELVQKLAFRENVSGKSNCAILLPTLTKLCTDMMKIRVERVLLLRQEYFRFMDTIRTHRVIIQQVVECIGRVDMVWNHAHMATTYGYSKPMLLEEEDTDTDIPTLSRIRIKGLRHILIEQIQRNELYVPNDIEFDKERGMLLYGTNAVGKSSLIRSIGISVILAQAGLFVPCASMEFSPFARLFTRILGNDNIFKGLSTFMVEMTELNTILTYANESSLVLGDELCSGTEIPSAISIFTASLEELMRRQTCFMFATHFHELIRMETVKTMKTQGMRINHLSVRYDAKHDCLVYDRKLKEGNGNTNYGLEVCRSIHMPLAFLERANQIRLAIVPEERVETKHTPYSAKRLKTTMCECCRENITSEVHHLTPQQLEQSTTHLIQTEEGQHFHKNHPANLISVCHACHDKFHETMETTTKKTGHRRTATTKGYKIYAR